MQIDLIIKELKRGSRTQKELKNMLSDKGYYTSEREIRKIIEIERKKRSIIIDNKPYFIISGNFGYQLVEIGSQSAKRWLKRQYSQIKNMKETINVYNRKRK